MNGRRAGAFVVAAVLIVGAWLVRSQVIDDSPSSAPRASTIVCVSELADICRAAVQGRAGVTITVESANATLNRLGSERDPAGIVWITMQPFPAMVDRLRTAARLAPFDTSIESLASSPLTLVAVADRAPTLSVKCGDPVDWRCLGELAGEPWTDADPNAAPGDVRPAFAPHPDTAIGQLGVADAVVGYFGGARIDPNDTGFITWTRGLSQASSEAQLGGNTAINRIQVRSSLLDIAVGAAAELTNPDDARFALLATSPAVSVDVVAMFGGSPPDGVIAAIAAALTDAGWNQPTNASAAISADDMLLIRTLWEELT